MICRSALSQERFLRRRFLPERAGCFLKFRSVIGRNVYLKASLAEIVQMPEFGRRLVDDSWMDTRCEPS